MNSSISVLLILFCGVALIATLIVVLFKLTAKLLGVQQVVGDGIVMTETGLEYGGFLKLKANYADIESVELLPFNVGFFKCMFYYNGFRSHWIRRTMFGDIVVITFKGSRIYKNLLFTPKDAPAFIEQLQRRIKQAELSSA
jgi:hypothetical protein